MNGGIDYQNLVIMLYFMQYTSLLKQSWVDLQQCSNRGLANESFYKATQNGQVYSGIIALCEVLCMWVCVFVCMSIEAPR